ncbi:CHAD domain-containing protein [Marinobacter daepoensis]|uniref:CHAD domain-containing protein n=1 Tax=Marinobacter daepoensis TaxID=262077 RepID=A0ABS3BAS9_9GAMM|nr:CHAD domain-containing protein [Marinobacter daepoensis]MBN7768701.1 CHAD domain-containing protein [Marinobacter daepoensis]MBY6079438.1 CHAD domain-containing protein [Marinobacter daepoensis]
MKRLFLIRHAKSSWQDDSLSDRQRPLSERGEHQLTPLARTLNSLNALSGTVFASPAVRAQQTLEGLRTFLSKAKEVGTEPELYTFDYRRLLHWLQSQPGTHQSLTVIGHNPALLELAAYLVPQAPFELPTAGIIEIRLPLKSWKKVGKNTGRLETFLAPRDFSYQEFLRKNRNAQPVETVNKAQAIPAALLQLSTQLEKLTPGVTAGLDDEFLHQYRVALRRSRAIAESIADLSGDPSLTEHISELKRHARATSPLRDLHVFLQDLPELCDNHPELLQPLTDWAGKKSRDGQRKLVRRLTQTRYQQSLTRWQDYLHSRHARKLTSHLKADDIHTAVEKRLKRFNRRTAELLHTAPDDAFHRLRKELKRIRYLMELDSSHWKPALRQLRSRQDLYGRFQDLHVQATLIERFEADCPEARTRDLRKDIAERQSDVRRQILSIGGLNV